VVWRPPDSFGPISGLIISFNIGPSWSLHLPVRSFTWKDLPDVLEFVGSVQAQDERDRKPRQQVFKENLGQPGLEPEVNCLLLEDLGKLKGVCVVFPEAPISRAVLAMDMAPEAASGPLERELLHRSIHRCRDLNARIVHICIGSDSPRAELLKDEGFSLARVYWEMVWQQEAGPAVDPPEGFTIRSFQPGDAAALTEVQNAAFSGSWGFSPNTVEQIEYRTSMSNTSPEGILFLVDHSEVAGYCWTVFAPVNGKTRGIIGMIGISPKYRGRGISRPILAASLSYLKSAGAHDVGLHVDSNNAPAIGLYTSLGFNKVGELHWYELNLPGA
jgi:mycothiol synthase